MRLGHRDGTDRSAQQAVAGRARTGALGFYTTGQLFLEEYYTLAVLARAGIGTNHLDGNTRLCTATAGEALKETFGCDGQPGSYSDLDVADTVAMFGHNVAETQTVLWTRLLDRLVGSPPPRLVVVDPRLTPVARRATVHLAPRLGTNLALPNALLHEIIDNGWVDQAYVDAHTIGFAELEQLVAEDTPAVAAGITGVPARDIEQAAELLGTAQRLVSTVLQGVYQSNQATATAMQVNTAPLARNARQAGLRRAADERPTHRAWPACVPDLPSPLLLEPLLPLLPESMGSWSRHRGGTRSSCRRSRAAARSAGGGKNSPVQHRSDQGCDPRWTRPTRRPGHRRLRRSRERLVIPADDPLRDGADDNLVPSCRSA